MGIIPLWGFQMLIAIAVSVYYRLNKALVLIAANISFPPFIPLILYISHRTGKIWMGASAVNLSFDKDLTFKMIYKSFTVASFVQYILGAVTLSTLSGLFFGLITFILLKIFRTRKPLTQA
jgi:uncharacterized protein (DUF2062 family)